MVWYLNRTVVEHWAYAFDVFTPEECDRIIKAGLGLELKKGRVGQKTEENEEIRKSEIAFFDVTDKSTEWIYQRVNDLVNVTNKRFWDFDLSYIETLQFTKYSGNGGFYEKHTDQLYDSFHLRKLSLSIQLSDPESYEGANLMLHIGNVNPPTAHRNRGSAALFPSYTLHEVTPITKGERYSLVAWVCGPKFK